MIKHGKAFLLQILIPTLVIFLPGHVFADATVRYKQSDAIAIDITGTINPSDYKTISKEINQLLKINKEPMISFFLNTDGGDVQTALQIGSYMRKIKAWAGVVENASCSSACVFILAGATSREIDGRVGIHRPYNPNSIDSSSKSQKQKYKQYEKLVKSYLDEMNIQTKLYDDMIYISPENIKYLTENELQSYGLVKNDPYDEEANAAKEALRYGITRLEHARRRAFIEANCNFGDGVAYLTCYDGVFMFGPKNWRQIYEHNRKLFESLKDK